ncbi:MAG TPA: DUF3343 domain-containing protein [Clostridia bacterium]|nr:DUF3343 domain-containing protein [Clostridia bacterium]
MEENYIITTFYSTHLALKFENLLKKNNLKVKIIPVPRQISASCGLAGRALSKDYDIILNLIEETSFDIEEIYEKIDGEYYKRK